MCHVILKVSLEYIWCHKYGMWLPSGREWCPISIDAEFPFPEGLKNPEYFQDVKSCFSPLSTVIQWNFSYQFKSQCGLLHCFKSIPYVTILILEVDKLIYWNAHSNTENSILIWRSKIIFIYSHKKWAQKPEWKGLPWVVSDSSMCWPTKWYHMYKHTVHIYKYFT